MSVGDLVRYKNERDGPASPELGIITETAIRSGECHVVWYTCNNEGWWKSENLEVVSENR